MIVAAPATPETHQLIDAKALAAMRRDAVLVNVARGTLVDEAELVRVMRDEPLAAAVLIGENPKVIEYEVEKKGSWTTNVYDTFRPSAKHEVGNNEVSLYTYLDALEGSYNDYITRNGGPLDFDTYFAYNVYHTPYHLYDFNPKNMKQLLIQTGFKSIETVIGGHTLPQRKFYRWSSVSFGGLAETLLRITAGKFLLPGVSKTTIAYKDSWGRP